MLSVPGELSVGSFVWSDVSNVVFAVGRWAGDICVWSAGGTFNVVFAVGFNAGGTFRMSSLLLAFGRALGRYNSINVILGRPAGW